MRREWKSWPPPVVAKPVATTVKTTVTDTDTGGTAGGAQGAGGDSDSDATGLPAEILEAATNLNALSWQALQAKLKEGGLAAVVIKAALEIEQAKPEADQRATTIKLLTKAIEA